MQNLPTNNETGSCSPTSRHLHEDESAANTTRLTFEGLSHPTSLLGMAQFLVPGVPRSDFTFDSLIHPGFQRRMNGSSDPQQQQQQRLSIRLHLLQILDEALQLAEEDLETSNEARRLRNASGRGYEQPQHEHRQ